MTAKAIYTKTGWKLIRLGLLFLLAGSFTMLLLMFGNGFKFGFLTLIILPLLFILCIAIRKGVRLVLNNEGIYRESSMFTKRSLLVPWRQVQRIDKQNLRFYSSLHKVTIYLSGNRKVQFIMPHAEEFLNELQFRVL